MMFTKFLVVECIIDWVLVSVWVILWIVGCVVQFYTERGKADFPKSPRELRKERHVYGEYTIRYNTIHRCIQSGR